MSHAGHLVLEVRRDHKLLARYEPPKGKPFRVLRHPIICCPKHERMALEPVATTDRARLVVLISVSGDCPQGCDYLRAAEAEPE